MAKKKNIKKPNLASRTFKSRIISFFVGIVVVLIIALLIFQYAKDNNYKDVLGKQASEFNEQVR